MNWQFWKKRSFNPENPNCALTGDNITGWVSNASPTKSGESVTPENSWTYSAVYAAVRLLSETIAQLPLVLHQKSGDRTTPATEHPVYNLTHNNPSDRLTSFVWRETQMGHAVTWGNGFAFIGRNGDRSVRELALLNPASTYVVINPDRTFYYQATIGERSFSIPPGDMLHVPALGWDGYAGKSPIQMHRETIGLSQATTNFGAQLFGNGTNWGGVLKTPKELSVEAKLRLKDGLNKFRGQGYQGAMILDEDMSYERIGIPPDDAQFLETRRFQISEIARIYNIPPHMLRDLEKSSFNNISEQSIEFLRYSISPWLVKWEQELNRKLLTDEERRGGYYFKFSSGGLLRGTQKERFEAYGKGITDGWLSRNEVRKLEDLDPVDGLDEYLVPLNMAKSDDMASATDSEPEPGPEPAARAVPESVQKKARAFSAWLHDVDARSQDFKTMTERMQKKLPQMNERYIEPVITSSSMKRWNSWLLSQRIDDMPDADEIAQQMMTILEESSDADRAA